MRAKLDALDVRLMTDIPLPLELGNVSPGPGFVKISLGKRPDGLPDGVHTGGPWLSPDESEVWKPLDAKPNPIATERYATDEAECLAAMDGKPGFPRNWRVEQQNGRRWLVRPRCYLWPQDKEYLIRPKLNVFLMIEQAIFALNSAGWAYNDLPQLAYDPTIHEWFLLDCSAAHKPSRWWADSGDWYRMPRWFEAMELTDIKSLRERGAHVHHAIQLPEFCDKQQEPYDVLNSAYPRNEDERREHCYLYVSKLRPVSTLWFRVDGTFLLSGDTSKRPRVHTWIASTHLLDDETVDRYELSFAYRPWP